jgi:hypothetical protein
LPLRSFTVLTSCGRPSAGANPTRSILLLLASPVCRTPWCT